MESGDWSVGGGGGEKDGRAGAEIEADIEGRRSDADVDDDVEGLLASLGRLVVAGSGSCRSAMATAELREGPPAAVTDASPPGRTSLAIVG